MIDRATAYTNNLIDDLKELKVITKIRKHIRNEANIPENIKNKILYENYPTNTKEITCRRFQNQQQLKNL